MQPDNKFQTFIQKNLQKVLHEETLLSLGDRSTYVGASDIGGCPYKTVMSKKNPPAYSFKQQLVFQRGHVAETIVAKMLRGLNVIGQKEAIGEIDEFELKAHIDFLIQSKSKNVIVEAKSVSAPTDEPYEAWLLQVIYQMGLLLADDPSQEIEAYVLAMDLNTGWLKTFKIEFDDNLFELCLGKAVHIIDALKGNCEPRAIIQNYCGSCHLLMQCPKQGLHATELPVDIDADVDFIKKSKEMQKESKLREARVKEYLVNTGVEKSKSENCNSVVTVKEQESTRFDLERFRLDYPELAKKYVKKSSTFKMTVL